MKKIVVIGCMLLSMSVGAFAQQDIHTTWASFHAAHETGNVVGNLIDRAVLLFKPAPEPAKPVWVEAVNNEMSHLIRRGVLVGFIPSEIVQKKSEPPVPANQRQTIQKFKTAWQKALAKNPYFKNDQELNGFQVKILRPQDVVKLSQWNKASGIVTDVLAGQNTGVYVEVENLKRSLVHVTIDDEPLPQPVHLVFNCYAKEVYMALGDNQLPGVPLESKN